MVTLALACLLSIILIIFVFLDQGRPVNYPPGPKWWPFFGNTSLLRDLARKLKGQHLALSKLAKDYGTSVLGLKLGRELVVVVFTGPVVKEVLTRDEFIGRPDTYFLRLRSFGSRRGITCTDGPLWQEQRAFTVRHLKKLGFGKSVMEDLIKEELLDLIQMLKKEEKAVNIGQELAPTILSVLWNLTAGKRLLRSDDTLRKLLELLNRRARAFDMAGGNLNQFPWLRFVAPEKTGYSLVTRLNSELRSFLIETIEEHKKTYRPDVTRDLIDAFFHEMEKKKDDKNSFYTDDQLIMVLLDLFIAGAQTTSNTLDFAFLLMMKNPEVQEKVYQNIIQSVGVDSLPTMTNKSELNYTEAVLLEVQRICHVTPITGPRRSLSDTTINGYYIPKNTTILISQWSVHRDESLFPNPDTFLPERFLDAKGNISAVDNLIPFGLGKRRCLGEILAKSCIFLIFTGMLQHFKISKPDGESEPTLEPLLGITLAPQPYLTLLKQR